MMQVITILAVFAAALVCVDAARPPGTHVKTLHQRFAHLRNHLSNRTVGQEATAPPPTLPPYGYVTVLAFGAVSDGVTDCTAAFQNALNEAAGGKVFVPAGQYFFSGTLVVPSGTVLQGVNEFPFRVQTGGSILLATAGAGNSSAPPFLYLTGPDAGVVGLTVYYPQVNPSTAPPVVYPPCIRGNGDDISIVNVFLANPYYAIDLSTYPCGRHLVDNVYGQPLAMGISVDQIYDIGRIRNIHFWPFWTSDNALLGWIHSNGVTFLIKRTDWEVIEDVFSWGYNRGMVFDESTNGACNGQFSNIDFDDVGIGIEVKHSQPYGLMFSNLNLANAGDGTVKHAIQCTTTDSNVELQVRGLSVWGQFRRAVYWKCPGKLTVSDGVVRNWDKTVPGIDIQRGRAYLTGLHFGQLIGIAINVASTAERAIVTANDLSNNAMFCNSTREILCHANLP